MVNAENRRREPRFTISSAVLPFMGTRASDYQPFQYLVQDISAGGIKIAVPDWVQLREILHTHEWLNLHVPFHFQDQVHDAGIVAWQRWDDDQNAQLCGVALQAPAAPTYPVSISLTSREIGIDLQHFQTNVRLLLKVLGDSVLVKRGLLIYLRHLNAYFLRTSLINREDFSAFREVILKDIFHRVQANCEKLAEVQNQVARAADVEEAFAKVLDLEELRALMEPEIYIEIFQNVLSSEVVDLYLRAVKALEQKLFLHYNTVVMLYLKGLE